MTRATFQKGAKLERIEKNLEDPRRALKQIGVLMVAESQRAFRDQKFGPDAWEPRGKVNTFGILADLASGGNPKARRFQRRPALRDTGRLSSSIASRVVGSRIVEVGTNLDYAAVHQEGGTVTSEKITPSMQRRLWKWLKPKGKDLKAQLGWLLNRKYRGQSLTSEVPARPFVGITKATIASVREVVGVEVMEAR